MREDSFDVVIVGAGAAGLMAGLVAAQKGARVCLLDSQTKIGAKILVAGGGRCNVTNEFVDASRFHGGSKSFIARVLRAFNMEQTLRFFDSIGVPLKLEETGKYFPVSDSSRTVLNALLATVHESGATLQTGQKVTDVCRFNSQTDGWIVRTPEASYRALCVILCTGGLALPKSGSQGAGYGFATKLGHTLISTTPALSPLLADASSSSSSNHAQLSGVTLPVRLSFGDKSRTLARYDGSFLFTHWGYSGPVALNLSRHVARDLKQYPQAQVVARFLPSVQDGDEGRFWNEFVRCNSKKTVPNALSELLPRRVGESVATQRGAGHVALGKLSPLQNEAVKRALLFCPLPVREVAGYVKAEATAGGVCLDEIEPATMMSRKEAGLFFAGEIVDVDGWLGGYNFQWAWSSGVVAGRSAARFALKG